MVSPTQVERWFRQRRQAELPNTLQKFCETGWRFVGYVVVYIFIYFPSRWVFYTCILVYGMICLWDKAWLWNIRFCWYNYPYHQVCFCKTHWQLSIWLTRPQHPICLDGQWCLVVLHAGTVLLLVLVHQPVLWCQEEGFLGDVCPPQHHHLPDHVLLDSPLHQDRNPGDDHPRLCWSPAWACQALSLCQLSQDLWRGLCAFLSCLGHHQVFFDICNFYILIFMTRCGLYPTWILYSTLYDAAGFIEFFPAYYIFNSLLVTLQFLHILWTYFLFKVETDSITLF